MSDVPQIVALGEAKTFEEYVTAWLALKSLMDELRRTETLARKHIAAAAFPQIASPDCAEGVHHFNMADGRKITYTHKISRKVDEALISAVRDEYLTLNDRPVNFDDLIKAKYEVSVSELRKIDKGTPAEAVIAKMLTAKPAETPDLKVS